MLLSHAKQIVCISHTNEQFKFCNPDLCILENSSIAIGKCGNILAIGSDIDQKYPEFQKIDCTGKCLLPGFVDPHTHALNAGDRSLEFIMKLEGATYQQIHEIGGGIYHTTRHVNEASEEELIKILSKNVKKAIKYGTTTMEVKSGYGLSPESELKMLRVIEKVNKECQIDLVSTYCGAHALPKGMNEQQATENVINEQLPLIKQAMDKGEIHPEFIDVFCEKNIYEVESSRQIMEAGKSIGLVPAFHGEELNHLESAKMGAQIGARSISHLEHLSAEGIEAMAANKIVGIILPTTHFILKLKDPPVRAMIEAGVPTALGSDFCPNAHSISLPFSMSLACINLKMKPAEALCAITLNAAAALGRKDIGSLEVGKKGDVVILDEPSWEHIIYQLCDSPIAMVIKQGKIIYQ